MSSGAVDTPPARWPVRIAAGLLVDAGLVAYHNSLGGPFVFDDLASILDNLSIRQWRPWWSPLVPPADFGLTVGGRPLVNLSLALNHAVSGTEVWSYHAFNLLVHLAAGLTLFGLVRRTLLLAAQGSAETAHATEAAFIAALLWLVHPLQTEAVTYVIQRAESLMALFYLLTLYAAVRAFGAEAGSTGAPRNGRWRSMAVVACALGMGCKEVMVTAPLAVLALDVVFGAGSWRAAWRWRGGFHLALVATWLSLAWLVATTGGNRGGTFSFTWEAARAYWLTQPEALMTYLRLAIWPSPLVFDYGRPVAKTLGQVWPLAIAAMGVVAAVLWLVVRRPRSGIAGALFLLVLLPTTLLPGAAQAIVEHRMYLPLAAVTTLVAVTAVRYLGRAALITATAVAALAAVGTIRRNAVYADDLTLWTETARERPGSAVARSNLAMACYQRGNFEEARAHAAAAVQLDPRAVQAWYNLGLAQLKLGRPDEALRSFTGATGVEPRFTEAWVRVAAVALQLGRNDAAADAARKALVLAPGRAEAHFLLGAALAATGQLEAAVASYLRAIEQRPDYAEAENNLGALLFGEGDLSAAEPHLRRAIRLAPRLADARFNLGVLRAAQGRADAALAEYAAVVRLAPGHPAGRLNYAIALAQAGHLAEARAQFEEARRRWPEAGEVHANFGLLLIELGELPAAIEAFNAALRLQPNAAAAHFGLAQALVGQGRWAEARRHVDATLRLVPPHAGARDLLDRWPR